MIILGYAGYNMTLRQQSFLVNRTCREATAREKGIGYLEELFFKNLSDLLKTIQWNKENNIYFYRISSELAPHCTNPSLLPDTDKKDFTKLVYPLEKFKKYLKRIGNYAKKNKIRLTFHPDLFSVLNSPDENVVLKTKRDLHFHCKLLELMELDCNSIVILHGGGVYGNKIESMKRWVNNFNKLPDYIKHRVVLENDETNFSVEDVLKISNNVNEFEIKHKGKKYLSKVPIVFDVFHYYCYNYYILKRGTLEKQLSITNVLHLVKKTWDASNRLMKIHISEQDHELVVGAHSNYVNVIPQEILDFAKKTDLYVMIEAKAKELAVLHLRKKYKNVM